MQKNQGLNIHIAMLYKNNKGDFFNIFKNVEGAAITTLQIEDFKKNHKITPLIIETDGTKIPIYQKVKMVNKKYDIQRVPEEKIPDKF